MESFEHPVSLLLVSSSQESNPVDSLNSLFDKPNPLFSSYIDPQIPKFYVLLHDLQSEHPFDKKFQQIQTVFEKSKCFILKLNSGTPTKQELGGISVEDNDAVQALSSQLISKGKP